MSDNIEKIANMYKEAANAGNTDAMLKYATMLDKGEGVKKDEQLAFFYYQAAAINGNTKAMGIYAAKLAAGEGIEKNEKEALKFVRTQENCERQKDIYNYAVKLFREGKVKESLLLYKKAADNGNINAMIAYAKNTISKEEAIIYYKKAADMGDITSMYRYLNHLEKTNKKEEAKKYFKKIQKIENAKVTYQIAEQLYKKHKDIENSSKNKSVNIDKYLKEEIEKFNISVDFLYTSTVGLNNKDDALIFYKKILDYVNENEERKKLFNINILENKIKDLEDTIEIDNFNEEEVIKELKKGDIKLKRN